MIMGASWVLIVAAFIAVLSFLYAASTPETPAEIALADMIFVASASILVYRIEAHLDSQGHGTLFRGRPGLALTFVALALGAIAGILAELASSDERPVAPAIVIYERQVQEVLGPLRETSAHAFKEPASRSKPDLYAKSARELELLERLREIGLFLVPVGELEGWAPTIGNHGPEFVDRALTQAVHRESARLRTFVHGAAQFLAA